MTAHFTFPLVLMIFVNDGSLVLVPAFSSSLMNFLSPLAKDVQHCQGMMTNMWRIKTVSFIPSGIFVKIVSCVNLWSPQVYAIYTVMYIYLWKCWNGIIMTKSIHYKWYVSLLVVFIVHAWYVRCNLGKILWLNMKY